MGFTRAGFGLADGVVNALDAMGEAARIKLQRRRIYRATFAELNSLTDRELADLGLRRSMIRGLAKEAALRAG